jgi:pimeloyl-ACP methyl ester carboxylesterase
VGHALAVLDRIVGPTVDVSAVVANHDEVVVTDTGKTIRNDAPGQVTVLGRLAGGVVFSLSAQGGSGAVPDGFVIKVAGTEGTLTITPGDPGHYPGWAEWRIVLRDKDGARSKLTLPGRDMAAGPAVLHGGGPGCHSLSDFADVMALLPARPWLWIDLPGYGASPALDFGSTVRAVATLLDRFELRHVDVLAQSLGGTIALRLAVERPDLIRRIALIGSQPTARLGARADGLARDAELGARARQKYYGGTGPSVAKMRNLMAELEWYDGSAVPEATVLARYRASVTPVALAAATDPSARVVPDDLGAVLGEVTAPTLVLWGRHDPFAGPDYAAELTAALPRGDLIVLGRTAHHPQAERPPAVAFLVDAYLKERN